MKITRLKVEGLFGLYDYDLDFNNQNIDFTILTSPNGYGKTTLLRIINSLHIRRLFYLYLLKFKMLTIWFDDGSNLIAKEPDNEENELTESDTHKNQRYSLILKWMTGGVELCRWDYNLEMIKKAKQIVTRKFSTIRHYEVGFLEDNVDFFISGDGGETLNTELAQMQKQEQFLLQLATVQTDFIGANRIYMTSHRERRRKQPILQVVDELKEILSEKVSEFQKNFQRLDSKLIDMLLEGKGSDIDETNYNTKADELAAVMEELTSFGLTNKQSLPAYQHENAKILDAYLNLMDEKLQFYKDFLPLVQLFNKNVIRKCFANKTIKLSPQHGLRIESDNGEILSADMLSTGEQNQLVLFYDLIFKTPKGSILLIDEPESSLHVAWQNDFVNDINLIARTKELQILVATHSSIIVSNTPENKVIDLFYL